MPDPDSVAQLDLTPRDGTVYLDISREWREEFIYFVMVDRFHDDVERTPVRKAERAVGFQVPDTFYGGTINGIAKHLDYIAELGCTAVWLSPIFENNANSYHGYAIENYLRVDPRFGSKADLINLVRAAHARTPPMRVLLDVVINHSGDNWSYPGNVPYYYYNDIQFPFGAWRKDNRPIPLELRQEKLYHRRGEIHSSNGYDVAPECQHGDISSLKDFANDDDSIGSELINILIKAHCYWIREADIDGFRVDAVKHMGTIACSRFCSNIREYAYGLGKHGFFLFGEVASADDELLDRYIGPNTSLQDGGNTVFFGLDSALDFRLAFSLRYVLQGRADPGALFSRLDAQRNRALNRGEMGRYLVTFVDNHDGFWQPDGRIGHTADDKQVVASIGYLLCALGTPCIYYGTEQGFSGFGSDNAMREAMFDRNVGGASLLNTENVIYRGISAVAKVMRANEPLRFGRMYFRQISGDGERFGFPYGNSYTLAFSRVLYAQEILVAYNVSGEPRSDYIVIDGSLHQPGDRLKFLLGNDRDVVVRRAADGTINVQLPLAPHEFVVLK